VIGQRHLYKRHHPLEHVWSSTWRDNTPRISEKHPLVNNPYTQSWSHNLVCDCPVGGVIWQQIANLEAQCAFVTEFASDSDSHPTPTPLKPLDPLLRNPKAESPPQYIARSLMFSPIICNAPRPLRRSTQKHKKPPEGHESQQSPKFRKQLEQDKREARNSALYHTQQSSRSLSATQNPLGNLAVAPIPPTSCKAVNKNLKDY